VTAARAVALDALARIEQGAFSHILVPDLLRRSNLAPRDRALVTAFVYGALRMQRVLDDALAVVSSRPLGELDADVRAALRLGAFQLFDGVPPHAAVGETVEVVPARARGFANGVLRALARRTPRWPRVDDTTRDADLGLCTSHPDWLVERLRREFGRADTVAMLTIDNEAPPVTLRPNPLRASADALLDELQHDGLTAARGTLCPEAVVLAHPGDPASIPAVRQGRATPQDQASQAVVAILDPQPGERVADLAAAPGGKATAAAERMADDGLVVASDVHHGRARLVRRAGQRVGLRSVSAVVADGRAAAAQPGAFDRVLLDAPCSGIGVLRRRPEARWRITPAAIDQLAALQRDLLAAAAPLVRPGGRLVYSVCTVTREETVAIDDWAREHLPELEAIAPPGAPWRPHGRGALLLPHDAGTDGMFALALQKAG
jgi:16S rRNA (cytosine967-C5)-methyltransferase